MINILNIKHTDNFSFDACLQFLNRGYDECLYELTQNYVRRLIRISSGLVLIQVSSVGEYLNVYVNKSTSMTDNEEITAYINDWFDLNRDISDFYELMDSQNETKEFSNKYFGLRLIGIVDLFEALCWCVIGQQINLTFAHKIKNRLVHQYGDHIEYDGNIYYCFPTPQVLNNFNREDLVNMQFSKQKIAYIENVSQVFCNGTLNKVDLLKLTKQQQMEKLLAIKGIGPWTANYVSMKSLRNMSCIAYGDTGLSSALHSVFKTDKKPNKTTIDKVFLPYSGWESYFNFYLWKSLSKV